jgi:hypothetical protein
VSVIIIILTLLWTALKAIAGFIWNVLKISGAWFGKYRQQTLCIVLLIISLGMLCVLLHAIENWFANREKKKNELALKQYLQNNCKGCGYMDSERWKLLLPEFAGKNYISSFENVTSDFAKSIEIQYISKAKDEWMQPVIEYLTKNGMADIFELTQVSNPLLKYTHYTSDALLIDRELEKLCKIARKDGKKMLDKIKLEREDVQKLYPWLGKNISQVYLNAYKISENFLTAEIMKNGNLIIRELSADDLGI